MRHTVGKALGAAKAAPARGLEGEGADTMEASDGTADAPSGTATPAETQESGEAAVA